MFCLMSASLTPVLFQVGLSKLKCTWVVRVLRQVKNEACQVQCETVPTVSNSSVDKLQVQVLQCCPVLVDWT